ncbi:hypothetical protein SDC9_90224 [bioreactor metagenome]|uniref:Uncharacterized protein n=1 Tax=bioreactor metagenome TaxID=1076179 RepID=A0A644ZS12_9ZZZZ
MAQRELARPAQNDVQAEAEGDVNKAVDGNMYNVVLLYHKGQRDQQRRHEGKHDGLGNRRHINNGPRPAFGGFCVLFHCRPPYTLSTCLAPRIPEGRSVRITNRTMNA